MTNQAEDPEKAIDETGKKPIRPKEVIRAVLFLVLALALFIYANLVLDFKSDNQDRGTYRAFYDLPEDFVDVAYIGSSAVSRYFINPKAYNDEGIAIYSFGSPKTPVMFYDDIIGECRTTQDPELYVLELRNLCKGADAIDEQAVRLTVGGVKLSSPNRLAMVEEYLEYAEKVDETGKFSDNVANYYLPFLGYHDRVLSRDLTVNDFLLKQPYNYMQGFYTSKVTLTQVPQDEPLYSTEIGEVDAISAEILDELLAYCDTLDAQVLFVMSPITTQSYEQSMGINALEKYVEDRGYDCINFNTYEMTETLGIDWETDLYNRNHLNYLGSEKYTAYFARYLKEEYDLEDHRGDPLYDDYYERGYKKYQNYVADGIKYYSMEDVAG